MIIDLKQFQIYSSIHTDNTELQESYLMSAQNIVSDYVGYDIEKYLLFPDTGLILENIEIPEIIKLTIMRIAAILQTEGDSNIGITSKSFGDSGTRTFINTVNFDKYLIQISNYRKIRI